MAVKGWCPAGEAYAKQQLAAKSIPVLSCEGPCIRGEIGRASAARAVCAHGGATVGSAALIELSDVVIEFSAPDATAAHVTLAAAHATAHVIGTTGLSQVQEQAIRGA